MNALYESKKAWCVALTLALFMLVNFIDKIAIGLVAVPLMDEFHLTAGQFGLVASSFFWLFSISCVAGGFLSNRFKASTLVLGMAMLWSLAQIPIIFASSITAIVIARVLLGIGEGPASPIAIHAAFKWFPDDRRALPVAVIQMGATVGLLVAGLSVPLVTAHYGWRANFAILAVIGVGWSLLWLMVGAEGSLEDEPSGRVAAATAADAHVIPYRRLLAVPTVWGAMVMHFVAYWALALTLTWLPVYLQKGLGFNAIASGRVFALVVLFSVPINLIAAWFSQWLFRHGRGSRVSRAMLCCFVLALAGGLFLCLPVFDLGPFAKAILIALAAGLPPIVYSLGPSLIAEVVPTSQRGAMLAIDNAVATVAAILAPAVTGWLIEANAGSAPAVGYEHGFFANGVLLLVGALVGFVWIHPAKSAKKLLPNREAVETPAISEA